METTKTSYRLVTVPEVVVHRNDDGDEFTQTIPAENIHVPFSTSNADAIDKALRLHRQTFGIPSNVAIMPTVQSVPLVVGTTVESASMTARFRGRR